MSFVGALQALASTLGPWFIRGKNIGTFVQSVGATLDSEVASLELGLKLSQPLNCDASALPILSDDRTIRIYPSEPETSQRLRLASWWQLHQKLGTPQGRLRNLQPYFLPSVPTIRVVYQNNAGTRATWHTLDGFGTYSIHKQEPSNWNYDGLTSHWWRYYVIIYPPAGIVTATQYDTAAEYDQEGVFYDGVATQVAQDLATMAAERKAAHSRLGAVILATDPFSFDPTATATTDAAGWTTLPVGNWGSVTTGPPNPHFTRLPTALWLYEGAP